MKCAMNLNFRVVIIWMVLCGSYIHGTSTTNGKTATTSYPTCPNLSKGHNSQYIEGYNLLPPSDSDFGCASRRSQVTANGKYKENHVINLINDRAATIYLFIRGIQRRTTNLLPHSKEYAFALYSNQDVTWLVSLENMPKSNVTYKFYLPENSKLISTDNLKFSIVGDGNDGLSGPSLKNRLTSSKTFSGEELTSFTELSPSRYARADITTYLDQYDGAPALDYVGNCTKLKKNFQSPVVAFELYKENEPTDGCEADNSMQSDSVKTFVVEIAAKNTMDGLAVEAIRNRTISLEIQEPYRRTGEVFVNTTIVLKSDIAVQWDIRMSQKNSEHEIDIVMESDTASTTLTLPDNFHIYYDEFQAGSNSKETNLVDVIEASIGKVISCMKFDSLPNFIAITLDKSQPENDTPDLSKLIWNIYEKLELECAGSTLRITVPRKVLEENQISIDALKFGTGNCEYTTDWSGDHEIKADETCGMKIKDRKCQIEIHFPLWLEIPSIPVECKQQGVIADRPGIESGVKTRCTEKTFVVTIPKIYLSKLDVTMLKSCRNYSTDESVNFHLVSDDGSTCASVKSKIKYELQLPLLIEDGNLPVMDDVFTLTCIFKKDVGQASYNFDIYEDFNLKKRLVRMGSYLRITDKVYQAKVSIISDPSTSFYISYCNLKSFDKTLVLVRNNCPVDPDVRFVMPQTTKTHFQQFSFMPGRLFSVNDTGYIECEVTACMKEAANEEIPYMATCLHLHGSRCSETSSKIYIYALPPNNKETIKAGPFKLLLSESSKSEPLEELKKESSQVNWVITLLLAITAFFLGCLLFFILWQIDRRTYKQPKSSRINSKRCESNSSGGSGSGNGNSHSSSSTKTTDASSRSFLCFRSDKENRDSNLRETHVMMEPLLQQPQSANSAVPHQSQLSKTNPRSSRNEIQDVTHLQYFKPTKMSENSIPNGHDCHVTANGNIVERGHLTKDIKSQPIKSLMKTAQQEKSISTIQDENKSKMKQCRDNQMEKPQTDSSEATSSPTSFHIKKNDDLTIAGNTSHPSPLRSSQNGFVSGGEGASWLCDPDVSLVSRFQNLKEVAL